MTNTARADSAFSEATGVTDDYPDSTVGEETGFRGEWKTHADAVQDFVDVFAAEEAEGRVDDWEEERGGTPTYEIGEEDENNNVRLSASAPPFLPRSATVEEARWAMTAIGESLEHVKREMAKLYDCLQETDSTHRRISRGLEDMEQRNE